MWFIVRTAWRRGRHWIASRAKSIALRNRCGARRATACDPVWRIQAMFVNFRRILQLNNAALEQMAHLERALGGEYIFDRAFLESSVRQLTNGVHHGVYCLYALTGNAFVALYDRLEEIQFNLQRILAGDALSEGHAAIIPFERIGWDMEPLVGLPAVALTELHKRFGVSVLDGCVVTAAACRALGPGGPRQGEELFSKVQVLQGLRQAVDKLRSDTGSGFFTLTLIVANDPYAPPVAQQSGILAADVADKVEELLATFWVADQGRAPAPVMMVQAQVTAPLSGEVRTRAVRGDGRLPEQRELLTITASHCERPGTPESYWLRRAHPFEWFGSSLIARDFERRFTRTGPERGHQITGLRRGSALLVPEEMYRLAETALILERLLGATCVVQWSWPAAGGHVIGSVTPLAREKDPASAPDLDAVLSRAKILCRGGQTVQSGIAAGIVVPLDENSDPADLPTGAIAVAAKASPRLAPFLRCAGALLCATGTATGHLATIAREMRIPAIFGLAGVETALTAHTAVTVDAGATVVYEGILDELLNYAGGGEDLDPIDPEYRMLRQLLRFVQPLTMIDPEAPDFIPDNCRSLHDILHFCHERAVHELAHLQQGQGGLGVLRTRSLPSAANLTLQVLDIGGGLTVTAGEELTADDVRCEPLSLFLEGLRYAAGGAGAPVEMHLGDLLMAVSRTAQVLNTPPEVLGGNLAIVATDYLNLSLRLGYHFNVIEALLGGDPQRDYVYFRFVGGLADTRRRERRARLIQDLLATLDFNVVCEGDLVVGRLKLVPAGELRRTLWVLGALTVVTRQLDTRLHSDTDSAELLADFSRILKSWPDELSPLGESV